MPSSSFDDLEVEIWEFSDRELSDGDSSPDWRICSGTAAGEAGFAVPRTLPLPNVLEDAIFAQIYC